MSLWRIPLLLIGMLALLSLVSIERASAQANATPPLTQVDAAVVAYQTEQRSLLSEHRALIASGATREQVDAWHQQNASRFAAQQEQAQVLADQTSVRPRRAMRQPVVPSDASPTLAQFLTVNATLANVRAQIHDQSIQSLPANATTVEVDQRRQQEAQFFDQQYGVEVKYQQKRAKALGQESARQVIKVPGRSQLPVNITPAMATYLTTREQLMHARVQLHNQYATAEPATRRAAFQQWQQQNAALIQQTQQQAQSLAQGN